MLVVNFEEILGTVEFKLNDGTHYKSDICSCNGLFAIIATDEDGGKHLMGFALDETHLENCLKDDVYQDCKNWTLKYPKSKADKSVLKIVKIFLKNHVAFKMEEN